LNEVPTREQVRAQGLGNKLSIQVGGLTEDEARELLVSLGYNGQMEFEPESDAVMFEPHSTIPTQINGLFDEMSARAVAKVAMNYLAHQQPQIARMEQTTAIRRFVRFGEGDWRDFVVVKTASGLGNAPPGTQILLHSLSATWEPRSQKIVGHVSLLDWNKYVVNLAGGFLIEPTHVASGHAFDPFNQRILELTRQRSRQLRLSEMKKLEVD
jgi:hypothetical protein